MNHSFERSLILILLLSLSFHVVAGCVSDVEEEPNLTTERAETDTTLTAEGERFTEKQWSLLFYRGFTSNKTLGQTLGGRYHYTGEDLYSLEINYRLAEANAFRQLFGRLVDSVELNANVTYRTGGGNRRDIIELVPYVAWRWDRFPWRDYLYTTVAIGEGISYVSDVPIVEERTADSSGKTGQLINYLMLEATAALPQYKNLSLVFRIHHRSGAFGLYGAGNSGSNVIGLGIRYYFA